MSEQLAHDTDREIVQLVLSDYGHTLRPGPPGPWEYAARKVGLVPSVHIDRVERRSADPLTAELFSIGEGDGLLIRVRHLLLGEHDPEVVQINTITIPLALVEGSAMTDNEPLRIYPAFVELGITPTTMTEKVSARMPTSEEAAILDLAPSQPVLVVTRLTRDADGRVIEKIDIVATADRIELVYDDLPLVPSSD